MGRLCEMSGVCLCGDGRLLGMGDGMGWAVMGVCLLLVVVGGDWGVRDLYLMGWLYLDGGQALDCGEWAMDGLMDNGGIIAGGGGWWVGG